VSLPAFAAAERHPVCALLKLIGISCPPGPQQQTCGSFVRTAGAKY